MEPPAAAARQVETDDQIALLSKPRKKRGNSDLASAAFNIVNSIIGSGIIGLPYSMKEAGFPLGVLLLFVVAYITDYSIILLIKGGNLSSTNTYQELVRKTYGRGGYIILSTLQFLYPFIAMISYNIITGDTLTKVFQRVPGVGLDNVLTDRHFIILLTTIIFTLPLSLYQDIAKLGKISLISLILTVVILIIVMVRTITFSPHVKSPQNTTVQLEIVDGMTNSSFALDYYHPCDYCCLNGILNLQIKSSVLDYSEFTLSISRCWIKLHFDDLIIFPTCLWLVTKNNRPKSENAWTFARSNAVQAIGVMSFAFICNHNSFLIYGSLEEPTLKNWSQVTHTSVSLAVVISVMFAVCGYITFTGYTEGDIFENYCRDDNLATFGRFCYGVTVILTFPLECFVTREVIANVFFHGNLSTVFHIVVTVVIIAVATGVSLAYDCLGIVLELNGVLSATPLVFIIPSACYLRLSKERWNHSDNLISGLILALGVLVMAAGFVMTVLHPQDCSHGKEMFYCFPSNVSVHNSTLPP